MNHPLSTLSLSLQTRVRKLAQKKYRSELRQYILEGERLVADALSSDPAALQFIVLDEAISADSASVLGDISDIPCPVYTLPKKEFSTLSATEHPQGILAVASMPESPVIASLFAHTIVTALHEIRDPGNLGTVLRTGDWFGAGAFALSPESADPYNPKAVRASMGSILRTSFCSFESYDELFQLVAQHGFTALAADAGVELSLYDIRFPEKVLLLFGSEAHGLPADVLQRSDVCFGIPRFGGAESLNLAASHAATLSELRRQRQ